MMIMVLQILVWKTLKLGLLMLLNKRVTKREKQLALSKGKERQQKIISQK